MFIVDDEYGLKDFLDNSGIEITKKAPVLIDQFLEDAFEYDLDAVSDGKSIYIGGILQHIEAAGIHSGDSAAVFPPYKAIPTVLSQMREWALKLAQELQVKGLMNIQFASKEDKLYIIEVNPRGSRTIPFISKASGVNLVEAAVRVWNGEDLVKQGLVHKEGTFSEGHCITGWAIKEAVFSFDRFSNVDPALGPEMRSTGEAIGMAVAFLPGKTYQLLYKVNRETIDYYHYDSTLKTSRLRMQKIREDDDSGQLVLLAPHKKKTTPKKS